MTAPLGELSNEPRPSCPGDSLAFGLFNDQGVKLHTELDEGACEASSHRFAHDFEVALFKLELQAGGLSSLDCLLSGKCDHVLRSVPTIHTV